jgi:hypothetical protein
MSTARAAVNKHRNMSPSKVSSKLFLTKLGALMFVTNEFMIAWKEQAAQR